MVCVEQLSGRLVVDAAEPQCRESRVVYGALLALAARRKHDDGLMLDAPGDEGQDAHCRTIQPLRVLGDDQQRLLLGKVGEQLEQGERDEEPVWYLRLDHAESRQERSALRRGQMLGTTQHRQHELVQARER